MTQRTNQPVQLTFDKAVAALHKVGGGVQCSDGVTPTRWLAAKAGISVPALTMALRKHDRDERLITRVTKGKRTFSIRVTTQPQSMTAGYCRMKSTPAWFLTTCPFQVSIPYLAWLRERSLWMVSLKLMP